MGEDIETLKFNTAIATMMGLLNTADEAGGFNKAEFRTLLILLNPFAPHITSELFEQLGFGMIHEQKWPKFDEAHCSDDTVELAVQVNGKIKATISIDRDEAQDTVLAKAREAIADKVTGTIVKEIYVPGRIVNIVAK